jgi:hypothetical protein
LAKELWLLVRQLLMVRRRQVQRSVRALRLLGQKWELVGVAEVARLPVLERQVPQCQQREVPPQRLHQ